MATKRSFPKTQRFLLAVQVGGDFAVTVCGLVLGYLIRFHTPLRHVGIRREDTLTFLDYAPLIGLGALFLLLTYAYLNAYDGKLLLRPHRVTSLILKGTTFWLFAFLGLSLVLRFEPQISRIFMVCSWFTTLGTMMAWRYLLYRLISRSPFLLDRLTQRVAILGWNEEALVLADTITRDDHHPYQILGVISDQLSPGVNAPDRTRIYRDLGSLEHLEEILRDNYIDILIVANIDFTRDQLVEIASQCERHYVQFKIIPSFFQIFLSSLRLQTISGIPIMGVEELAINQPLNRFMKRSVDIVGALVGLAVSIPVMAVLALLIKRESPGPVFYRQTRTGLHGRPFTIYKMRSMRIDAEAQSGARWAVKNDPRRTRIGTFMRETNLDELPQFWNVLTGDMSLIGPRPERPELIASFEREIPHYNPRHEVRPGLSGWAQVNGLRGDTSLVERIKYDLFYIENWSLFFDFQILVMTFIKRDNAY
ncbi:MAG: sugar transferase [Puniceicoccaceae bacterium]|nr:MAG: sugar transferase [Puniceicoccaceae bacterium]